MPFAPGISQILYVTNSGDFDGGVYVTAHDEDGTEYDLGMVATAGASSVTKITAQVKDALAAEGFDQRANCQSMLQLMHLMEISQCKQPITLAQIVDS